MLVFLQRMLAVAVARLRAAIRSGLRALVLASIAGVLLLIGLIVLITGIYQSMATALEGWLAGLIIALALSALAGCAMLLARSGKPRAAASAARASDAAEGVEAPDEETTAEEAVAAEIGATVSRFLRGVRPEARDMVIGAFIAGLLMSRDGHRKRNDDGAQDDEEGPAE